MLSDDQINQYVKELQFPPYPIIREYLQLAFLHAFYQNQSLQHTYFKGGTCLRLIFHSGRFSEDLDFTTNLNPQSIEKIIQTTIKTLSHEFTGISFKPKKTLSGNSYGLSYKHSTISMPISIKLDFSSRENVLDPQLSTITSIYPFPLFLPIPHLSLKEILAEKIRALTHRQKGRDLYDFHYLLSRQVPLDLDFINQKLGFYQETFNLESLQRAISQFPIKEFETDLIPFVPKPMRLHLSKIPKLTLDLLTTRLTELK